MRCPDYSVESAQQARSPLCRPCTQGRRDVGLRSPLAGFLWPRRPSWPITLATSAVCTTDYFHMQADQYTSRQISRHHDLGHSILLAASAVV